MFAVFEIFVKFSEIHGHFNAEQRYINHGRNFINCRVSVKNLSFTYYLAISADWLGFGVIVIIYMGVADTLFYNAPHGHPLRSVEN